MKWNRDRDAMRRSAGMYGMFNGKEAKYDPCSLCGYVPSSADNSRDHMVNQHGFMRVGAQVFRRLVCVMCPKPGLYRVGHLAYCRDHLDAAKKKRMVAVKVLDDQAATVSDDRKRYDYLDLSRRLLKNNS